MSRETKSSLSAARSSTCRGTEHPCPSSPLSADINENLLPPDLHRIALHPSRRVLPDSTRPYIVLPAMPGTSHHRPLQRAITQRPSAVNTNPVDRMELPIYIRQRHGFSLNLNFANRPRR